jgi:hypothetical protein
MSEFLKGLLLSCAITLGCFLPTGNIYRAVEANHILAIPNVTELGFIPVSKDVVVGNYSRQVKELLRVFDGLDVIYTFEKGNDIYRYCLNTRLQDIGKDEGGVFRFRWVEVSSIVACSNLAERKYVEGSCCSKITERDLNSSVDNFHSLSPLRAVIKIQVASRNLNDQTRSFLVYHQVSLSFDSPQGKTSQESANRSQSSQNPIGCVCGSESHFEIFFGMRLVVSVSLCIGCVFLVYFGSRRRWCGWVGISGMGLGMLLLLAPIQWDIVLCPAYEHNQDRQSSYQSINGLYQAKISCIGESCQ